MVVHHAVAQVVGAGCLGGNGFLFKVDGGSFDSGRLAVVKVIIKPIFTISDIQCGFSFIRGLRNKEEEGIDLSPSAIDVCSHHIDGVQTSFELADINILDARRNGIRCCEGDCGAMFKVIVYPPDVFCHISRFTVGRVVPVSPPVSPPVSSPVLSPVPPVSSSVFSSSVPAMVAADGVGCVYAMVGVWHRQANSSISRSSRILMICFIFCLF